MRRAIVLFLFFLISQHSFAQLFDGDEEGKIWTTISAYYDQGIIDGQSYTGFKIEGDIETIKHLSFKYSIGYGIRADSSRHFHIPGGTLCGPPLVLIGAIGSLAGGDNAGKAAAMLGIGLVLCALPEGVQANIYPVKWIKVSPYVMFTGLDFTRNLENRKLTIRYSPAFGGKVTCIHSKTGLTASGWFEFRSYTKLGFGQFYGFGLGYRF